MGYICFVRGVDIVIFKEIEDQQSPFAAVNVDAVRKDDFDVSLKYITDISAYHSSSHYFELLIFAEGSLAAQEHHESIPVPPRSVGFFYPGEERRFKALDDSEVVCYSLLISPYLLTEFCNLVSGNAIDSLFASRQKRMFRMHFKEYEYFLHLAELISSSEKEESLILTKRLAYNIISQLIMSLDTISAYPDWFDQFLEKVHLPEYFLSPMSEIYKLAPYSQPMLNSYFNRFMGETLVSYITKMKINYACNLLRFSELTVVEIASKTKYSSLSHFNHIFKKQIGMTPSEYRINNSITSSGDDEDEDDDE